MTAAQRHFPAKPSQCVEYGAGISHVQQEEEEGENFKWTRGA